MIPHSQPWITNADKDAILSVLASGMISKGDVTSEFENRICDYLGVKHGIGQSSGTAALILALRTLDTRQGDEIILPTYVCRSVLEAVISVGGTPVLCDVNESGVITEETVYHHITSKTKAIIAVHILGHPCDFETLKDTGITIIEDVCQALGLSINGVMAGTSGDVSILSFHATKCCTTGEGGMLVTQRTDLAERARQLADGSLIPSQRSVAPISDMQAALGLSQMARYPQFVERRTELRKQYEESAHRFDVAIGSSDKSNMLFRFILRSEKPFEALQARFHEKGISVRRGVDELLHRILGMDDSRFPNAVVLYQKSVSVPFYPALISNDAAAVCSAFSILKDGN